MYVIQLITYIYTQAHGHAQATTRSSFVAATHFKARCILFV